jgi:tetratricopeptide (TPR) repeat protein
MARLLARLKGLAPDDLATQFIEARWLMRNRDYENAESILVKLVEDAGDARFTFPLNGKWIRPPWTSVRDKSKLNLAFVYDVRGERAKALMLYAELLELGDGLNTEAHALGYIYDDIRHVIESYTRVPYTGLPEEAYRHFPQMTGIPVCDPQPPTPGNQW